MSLPEVQQLTFRQQQNKDYQSYGRLLGIDALLTLLGSGGLSLRYPFFEDAFSHNAGGNISILALSLVNAIMIAGGVCGGIGILKTISKEIPHVFQRRNK